MFSTNLLQVLCIFAEKVTKELEVIKLAFSNFLYNNLQNSTNALTVFLNACYHQLCSPETGKKRSINFIMFFAHFSVKKEEQTEAS